MRLFFIVCLLLTAVLANGQPPERVAGLPTHELYDLHVDQKGYLWVAHALGISRYDGLNFTNYTHPAQVNLHYTDIVEDAHHRIWFHNFSGQVFYVENGKTVLLNAYPFQQENQNPKMVRCDNEILLTSNKGLFVCNTDDLQTRFLPFKRTTTTAAVSLAVVNHQAVVYNQPDWYIYSDGSLRRTFFASFLPLEKDESIALQAATSRDTLFLTANPSGVLYQLLFRNNQLSFLSKQAYHDYINAVTVDGAAWVHTRNQSINLKTGNAIAGLDLSDRVTGREGTTWYGSQREGLLVEHPSSLWQKMTFRIGKDDYIRSLNAGAGYFFAGTQSGNLYRFDTETGEAAWKQEMFNGLGSIDYMRYLTNHRFLVGSTTRCFLVNAQTKTIEATLPIGAIQDIDFDHNSFYMATAAGLYVAPVSTDPGERKAWLRQKQHQFPFANWTDTAAEAYLLLPQQTQSVRFDPLRRVVYAATKNGLVEVNRLGTHPYAIGGRPVFATAVAYRAPRLYIATINDGLWIAEGRKARHFSTANTLSSNTIIRIKLTEDHLWLFEKAGIQVLDLHTNQVLKNLDLPRLKGANVLDVAEKGNNGYLTTAEGVYRLPLNLAAPKAQPTGYLDYVVVNGRDTVQTAGVRLPYQQNDVQFYFSSPAYDAPENISFRYRLQGTDNDWQVTAPGERMIRYSALSPGDYQFELYAVSNNGTFQAHPLLFPFTINKPWWRTWWFILLLNTVVVALIYLVIQNRIHQTLRLELIRRNISSDLHDDIGATLSSVNFYIDLAQTEKNNHQYLQYIKQNVAQVINNLDDLVWSINPKNDSTEQLLHHMNDYAVPLLKAAGIRCHFSYHPRLPELKLDLVTKRHLYLLFKEMVNNVAKHAFGQNCYIEVRYQHGQLQLSVRDDGKGFDPEMKRQRNGLFNMQERARKLKGQMEIESREKEGSRVAVTIPV